MSLRWLTMGLAMLAAVVACDDEESPDGGGGSGGGVGGSAPNQGCPTAAPSGGESCAPAGTSCTYGTDIQPGCRDHWECQSGQWTSVPFDDCNDLVPGDCPSTMPTSGSECASTPLMTLCEFTAESTMCACTNMDCSGGPCQTLDPPEWRCAGPPTESGCPAVVPNEGTACEQEGLECPYLGGPCGSVGMLHGLKVTCADGVWVWGGEEPCPV